ncbi:MAG: hypothetical protein EAZ85_10515 [Bacteroidetes bacterium]|nr:MAG: hypothetical protein EAZ85_10515 [Bacteroidota bacterium]TAG88435.1 MAG: hypothetical protein EAZ20_08535 [Bacteroidota bacterium]
MGGTEFALAQKNLATLPVEDEFQTLKREILCKTFKFLIAEFYGHPEIAAQMDCIVLDSIGKKIPEGYQEAKRLWLTFLNKSYASYGRKTKARTSKLIKDLNTELTKLSNRGEWLGNLQAFQVQLSETNNEIYQQLQQGTYIRNPTEKQDDKNININTKKEENKMPAIYVILLFLILAGGIAYLVWQNKKLQEQLAEIDDQNIERYSRIDNRLDAFTPLGEHKAILLRLNFLNEQLSAINEEVMVLKTRNQYKISPHELHTKRTEHLEKPVFLPDMQVYYAKFSTEKNGFDAQYFITEPTSLHIFKISINLNYPAQAMIRLVERSEFQQNALENPEELLEQVCVFANEPNNDARIINLENGLLEKKNNIWIVVKKIKISFEK